jgi:hypothetical protein
MAEVQGYFEYDDSGKVVFVSSADGPWHLLLNSHHA